MHQPRPLIIPAIFTTILVLIIITQVGFQKKDPKELILPVNSDLIAVNPTPMISAISTLKTQPIIQQPEKQPTFLQSTNPANLSEFIYPGSEKILSSKNSVELQSTDNTENITNWYKSKIKNSGMNTTSFATANANDNIQNELVGANGEKEVSIKISKLASQPKVKIKVVVQ